MEVFLLLPVAGIVYLALPLMTGWVATTTGRKFWLWVFLSCVLPGIATILLCVLPDKK